MPRILAVILIVSLPVAAISCSGGGKLKRSPVGTEQVVQRVPPKTPKWVEIPFEETKKKLFFKGEASGVHDAALGLRQAKAHAIQNMIEAIRLKARSEFSEAVRGVNASERSLGHYLDSVVAWTSDNVEVAGITPDAEYREKVLVRRASGVEYRYNCAVRLVISRDDYLRAREGAVQQALAVFQDEEARRLAEEAKRKLEQ